MTGAWWHVLLALALPPLAGLAILRLPAGETARALRLSAIAALGLALVAAFGQGGRLAGPHNRFLEMTSLGQLGLELAALAMLGFILAVRHENEEEIHYWLTLGWFSLSGLVVSLLVNSLPLACLAFLAAALVWAVGPPTEAGTPPPVPVFHYAALISLAVPLLLLSLRLAELRTSATQELEQVVLALALPGFGLLLAVIPLHAWIVSLAGGTPRMLFNGVLLLVQTVGFVLLLRTFYVYPWLAGLAGQPLIIGGGISAALGGWLALTARRDDPDDWLVFAAVANSGLFLAGLGTQTKEAGAAVALLLFTRVLALAALAIAPRASLPVQRVAVATATLTLAGTPGLAGFPALWVVLRRLGAATGDSGWPMATAALLLAGSGFLFATAIRRWRAIGAADAPLAADPGAARSIVALVLLLVTLGLAPQVRLPPARPPRRPTIR